MAYQIQSLSKQTKYNLSPRTGAIKYIVVHYTATQASAKNNVTYFSNGNRSASADFFIDNTSIWQFNPNLSKWFSWHCGDGHGRNGITNANSIGIEVVSDGHDFTEYEIDRLAWLVRRLMAEYGIDKAHVKRHYDASGKLCPAPYIDNAKWDKLKDRITGQEDDDMTNEEHKMLSAIYDQSTSKYDPTGRNKRFNDHDHIKWIAAKQADMDDRQKTMEAKLDAILAKLGD